MERVYKRAFTLFRRADQPERRPALLVPTRNNNYPANEDFDITVVHKDQDMAVDNSNLLYTSLDHDNKDIRLISLHPGKKSSPISCDLFTVRLDGDLAPDYTALSYEWGPPYGRKRDIYLSGKRFVVRNNLWEALAQMRCETKCQTLWVDAICINQGDIQERNHQVGIMGDVYRKASLVRVWLGPAESFVEYDVAFQLLHDLCSKPETIERSHLGNIFNSDEEVPFNFPLRKILYASYWTRIWIVQEYVLARKLVIHLGHYSMEGEEFDQALQRIQYLLRATPNALAPAMKVSHHRTSHGTSSLATLVELYLLSQSTDNRDKIYALLHLSNDGAHKRLAIDYNKSLLEVAYDVFNFLFTKSSEAGKSFEVWQFISVRESLGISTDPNYQILLRYLRKIEKYQSTHKGLKFKLRTFQEIMDSQTAR